MQLNLKLKSFLLAFRSHMLRHSWFKTVFYRHITISKYSIKFTTLRFGFDAVFIATERVCVIILYILAKGRLCADYITYACAYILFISFSSTALAMQNCKTSRTLPLKPNTLSQDSNSNSNQRPVNMISFYLINIR